MAHFLLNNGDKITFEGELQIDLLSPLFSEMNTYSLPGKIPNTPENSRALDRPELINSINNKVREYEAKLISNNIVLYGVIRVSEVPDEFYFNFNFTGQGAFLRKNGTVKMNELEYKTFNYPSYITEVNFSIGDKNAFIFENAYVFIPHFNAVMRKSYTFYNELADKSVIPANDFYYIEMYGARRYNHNVPPNTPWLLLSFILNEYSEKQGFHISENDLESSKFEHMLIYNNYNIEQLTFLETEKTLNIISIEIIDENTLRITVDEPKFLFINHHFLKIYNLTITNKENLNGRIFRKKGDESVEGFFDIEIDTALFTSGNVVGNVMIMEDKYKLPVSFEIGKHFPNMSAKDFLSELNIFGLKAIPGESAKTVKFKLMENIISDHHYLDITNISGKITDKLFTENNSLGLIFNPVEDDYLNERINSLTINHNIKDSVQSLSDLPLQGNDNNDVRYIINEGSFYVWNRAPYGTRQLNNTTTIFLGNWQFFSEWVDYGNIEGDIIIKTIFSPIPTYRHFLYGYGRELPRIEIATNHENSIEYTDCGLRFMFFDLDAGFPVAKSENEEISLKLHGEKGIFEKFHKKTSAWKLNRYRQCKSHIDWPLYLINNFAWDKKFRIKDTNYLVEKISMYVRHDDRIRFGDTVLART